MSNQDGHRTLVVAADHWQVRLVEIAPDLTGGANSVVKVTMINDTTGDSESVALSFRDCRSLCLLLRNRLQSRTLARGAPRRISTPGQL
jgi:hypothetical protein